MEMFSERETERESLQDLFRSVREAFPALNANVTQRANRTVSLPVLEKKFSARRIGAVVNGLSKISPPITIKHDWSIRSSSSPRPNSSTKVNLESKKHMNLLILCQFQFQFYL